MEIIKRINEYDDTRRESFILMKFYSLNSTIDVCKSANLLLCSRSFQEILLQIDLLMNFCFAVCSMNIRGSIFMNFINIGANEELI